MHETTNYATFIFRKLVLKKAERICEVGPDRGKTCDADVDVIPAGVENIEKGSGFRFGFTRVRP